MAHNGRPIVSCSTLDMWYDAGHRMAIFMQHTTGAATATVSGYSLLPTWVAESDVMAMYPKNLAAFY